MVEDASLGVLVRQRAKGGCGPEKYAGDDPEVAKCYIRYWLDDVHAGIQGWIYLAGIGLTAGTFVWKLTTDTNIARYRETIAFIEQREKEMRERWIRLKDGSFSGSTLEEEFRVFFNQLELVSLLVDRGAFDGETVYNYWWRFFDEPLGFHEVNTWVMLHQANDSAVFQHYVKRCRVWAERIDVESGRSNARAWWRRKLFPYRRAIQPAQS